VSVRYSAIHPSLCSPTKAYSDAAISQPGQWPTALLSIYPQFTPNTGRMGPREGPDILHKLNLYSSAENPTLDCPAVVQSLHRLCCKCKSVDLHLHLHSSNCIFSDLSSVIKQNVFVYVWIPKKFRNYGPAVKRRVVVLFCIWSVLARQRGPRSAGKWHQQQCIPRLTFGWYAHPTNTSRV